MSAVEIVTSSYTFKFFIDILAILHEYLRLLANNLFALVVPDLELMSHVCRVIGRDRYLKSFRRS